MRQADAANAGGSGTPSCACSSMPSESSSQSEPAGADQRDADGKPAAAPTPAGKRRHREARPVPEMRQRDQRVVGAGVVVPVAAQGATTGIVGSSSAVSRCSSSQAGPGARHLPSTRLRRDVRLPGHGTPLPLLDPLAQRRPVELAPAVEAAVIDEQLRGQDVEEVVAHVGARRRWRLDQCRAKLGAGVERHARSRWPRRHRAPRPPRAGRRPAACPRAVARPACRGASGPGAWSALSARPRSGPAIAAQQQLAVGERARHRTGVVEAPRQRHDAGQRDASARGLDRRGAAAGGRDAQRAGRVRACRRGDHACGQRRRRSAARAARGAIERPRAANLVGRPAGGELVGVQMAEKHHPRGRRRRHTSQSSAGTSSSRRLDAVTGFPATRVEILEPDRDAGERRARTVRVARPCAQALVGVSRGRDGLLLVDAHPRVDRLGVAVVAVGAVQLPDAPRQPPSARRTTRCAAEQRRRVGTRRAWSGRSRGDQSRAPTTVRARRGIASAA